ncbi:GGDEF domain-containing protein [Paenibacillus gorillae]|uniref:GGDEF domain-containing protein n=1 Tax=Paenibacillus gorillae TaxID=1243662 RepID=UPI0004B53CA7|nr:GGDEF domain-containing protein [Paenibacillus gorillae]
MGDIGSGLFNRQMIRAIARMREQGGLLGVLTLQYAKKDKQAEAEVQRWAKEQKRLFWQQQLGESQLFLFCSKPKGESIDKLISKAMEELRSRLGDRLRRSESAVLPFGSTGGEVEAALFAALRETAAGQRAGQSGRSMGTGSELAHTIGQLAAPFPVFPSRMKVSEVAHYFELNPKAQGAVIADEGIPKGLLMKEKLHQLLAGQFGQPLYWTRPVEKIMNGSPLMVDEHTPIEQVSYLAMGRDYAQLYDVVIVTSRGELLGAVSIRAILEGITALRTKAAREANPLTGLPGNAGIQEELRRRIEGHESFAVIYADLDYFKWFNDCYGFGQGDELIRFLAELLRQEKERSSQPDDFIGHIGGDDFIIVTDAVSGERLCERLIERFDLGVKSFYGDAGLHAVEDRHGNVVDQEGVTLSLSLMISHHPASLTPDLISRHSARLKKRAKAHRGSIYVKETLTIPQHREERN